MGWSSLTGLHPLGFSLLVIFPYLTMCTFFLLEFSFESFLHTEHMIYILVTDLPKTNADREETRWRKGDGILMTSKTCPGYQTSHLY